MTLIRVSVLPALLLMTINCVAEISFEHVSAAANIRWTGPTNGASWGDVNGDGYPDLFVANHRLEGNQVSLYLNRGNGTFEDIAPSLNVDPFADLHGAAWADFDNDGDEDLFVLAGGGAGEGDAEGQWSYPNHLFRNDDDTLTNVASQYGLEYPLGRGRTPLWLDADRDGRLDLLAINGKRPDGRAPSRLFLQRDNGFVEAPEDHGFSERKRTRFERYYDIAENLAHLRWRRGPDEIRSTCGFAQLADLDHDRSPDLVAYTDPFRIYATHRFPLDDVTNSVVFKTQKFVEDVVVGDFDGDARNDLFLLRTRMSRWWNPLARPSPVVQFSEDEIEGNFVITRETPRQQVRFKSPGSVRVTLYPQWVTGKDGAASSPSFRVGTQLYPSETLEVDVSPQEAIAARGFEPTPEGEVWLEYDAASGIWTLQSTESMVSRINFVVQARQPVEVIGIAGYERRDGRMPDALLLGNGDGFIEAPLSGHSGEATGCLSAVAGDFDNDMDLDLYLVCTDPVENTPNRLYENDGTGNFFLVADAGGAPGSLLGRGDSVITADYDLDGFLDLFVLNGAGAVPFGYDGPHQLFRNRGNGNHWLAIDLRGSGSNRDGIGAVVQVFAGGVEQVRDQGGGMHCYSQNHKRLHFGLANNRVVDEITVYWPSGTVQRLSGVAADRVIIVEEPAGS